jgi:hypothetical protein
MAPLNLADAVPAFLKAHAEQRFRKRSCALYMMIEAGADTMQRRVQMPTIAIDITTWNSGSIRSS